eukprot:CAMPEP_0113679554 /NCGR_PEP_ID=MMETSP0038_2-20120614/10723_1 /TAXON_ID=2898 /ORGANISM="Cryptomonas paramecium" /LENGTH=1045 /DNA_ID=CAMNT_0000597627 /DNA_START=986 /DNA_END=4119 /DNA_ORIENTATION=- /assembly_acc=CAM_ASM_000170
MRVGTLSKAVSLDAASVSSTLRGNLAARGASSLTVSGVWSGAGDVSKRVRGGRTACEWTVWVSATSLACGMGSVGSGGGSVRVVVTSGVAVGSLSAVLSYDAGGVSSTVTVNGVGSGSTFVTVSGGSFGVVSTSGQGRVGGSGAELSLWVSDTAMVLRTSSGAGGSVSVSVSVQGVAGSLTQGFSFGAGVSGQTSINRARSGSSVVTVSGGSFGVVSTSGQGRVGGSGAELSLWVSDTAMVLRTSSGAGGSVSVSVSVQGVAGSLTQGFSHDVGGVSGVYLGNVARSGSSVVSLSGTSFGKASSSLGASVGGTGCEMSFWVSETGVVCRAGSGGGGSLRLALSVGDVAGSGSQAVSYDASGVSTATKSNVFGSGSSSVTITGSMFGLVDTSGMGRVGGSGVEATEWESESSVRCKVGLGSGASAYVSLSAGLRIGSGSFVVSHDAGAWSGVVRSNIGGTGSMSVTVVGSALVGVWRSLAARVGGSAASATEWGSESSVVSRAVFGAWRSAGFVLSAGLRSGSVSGVVSYDRTTASGSVGGNVASTGSVVVSLYGSGFGGVADGSVKGRIGQSSAEATAWVSDSCAMARSGAGASGTGLAVVSVGVAGGSVTQLLSHQGAVLSVARAVNLGGTGSASVTVHGSGLGQWSLSAGGRAGASECEATEWVSASSVSMRRSAGGRSSMGVVVSAGGYVGSMSQAVSADVAGLSVVAGARNDGIAGSVVLTVLGSGVGAWDKSVHVTIGLTGSSSTSWVSETSAVCLGTSKLGRSMHVTVSAGMRVGTLSKAVSLDAASVSSTLRGNLAASGASSLTVSGVWSGAGDVSKRVRGGRTACEWTVWVSATSLACGMGSVGSGGGSVRVVVTSGVAVGSLSAVLSYDAGGVSSTVTVNGVGSGSTFVTVSGGSFGVVSTSGQGRVGGSGAELSLWVSDTAMVLRTSSGAGGSVSVSVSVQGVAGSLTQGFSFGAGVSGQTSINRARSGSSVVTVSGGSFGVVSTSGQGRVGGSGAELSLWVSDTAMVLRTSSGAGGSVSVSVSVQGVAGSLTQG